MAENEKDSKEKKKKIYHAVSLVIIGLGIGWLMGLSISPVVATVLSGILGAVLVLAAVLSGFFYGGNASLIKNISDVSPVPFAWLMLGIIAGTSLGILVRTHNVLGIVSVEKQDNSFTKMQKELTQLKKQEGEGGEKGKWEGLDIFLSDIAQRIIDKHYPKGGVAVNKAAIATGENKETASGLYDTNAASHCDKLLKRSDPSFRRKYIINIIDKSRYKQFAVDIDALNDKQLDNLIHNICPSSE
ncbi:MAG: hypothetical protein D3904_09875 [Candidatus Electrothrix sp. EH2]|nr:hypothetical protein [Candidatus Electrothrix sp. EH2]